MAKWQVITASEMMFEDVNGADVHEGVIRYVFQRKEDGSFGVIDVDGRKIHPSSSLAYVHGGTLHVQVE
ncbi:MAG: hypothetical protein Q8W45_09765 [Candidatus Palauibacterales bacterium]|jgi:hypothetical protein|nr:hypothetical protein [Candidatus Palauibacterales bacterium]MDP2483558.1 hypothetical protein [Candidatus Palauibacterales bacterium]